MADGSVTIEVTLTKEQLKKGLKSINSDLNELKGTTKGMSTKIAGYFDSIGKASEKAGKKINFRINNTDHITNNSWN